MRNLINIRFLVALLLLSSGGYSQNPPPFLQKKGNKMQLMVDNKPFIILGGELGNSSATSMESMETIWPKLNDMNLNTVLMPVYWELIEPEEGKFDFALLDNLVFRARKEGLKVVLLWFGSYKNSMSSHAPSWIKLNQDKYPRVKDDKGKSHEILTPFAINNLNADKNAFKNLMLHLKKIDETTHTVIMIQVENEIGMLPTARDYHPIANQTFLENIPTELMRYLEKNKQTITPELDSLWKKNGYKTKGTWEQIFGVGLQTDEVFMAWYFSKFTNTVAKEGKTAYNIPMFVNAALNAPEKKPGEYPSAGPLPHLMDIWKAAGESIDFLSPDFYNPDFKKWNDLYVRQNNPLFIPEHRFDNTAAAKALFAISNYEAIGFSPFDIESVSDAKKEPLGKIYNLIKQLAPVIHEKRGQNKITGTIVDKESHTQKLILGNFEFTVKHYNTLSWSNGKKLDIWPTASVIIIEISKDNFYVAGTGVVITFKDLKDTTQNVGILKVDQGSFVDGFWKTNRHYNGDQTHQGRHIAIGVEEYEIQKVKLYTYK